MTPWKASEIDFKARLMASSGSRVPGIGNPESPPPRPPQAILRQGTRRVGRPLGSYRALGPRDLERRDAMRALRASGASYAEIGRTFGVSRQCVHQQLHPDAIRIRHREAYHIKKRRMP